MNTLPIIIENISIRQDEQGRYCLNDLHKASGGEAKHKPGNWLRIDQTIELIEELTVAHIRATEQNQPVNTIQGGLNQGTYRLQRTGLRLRHVDKCQIPPKGYSHL